MLTGPVQPDFWVTDLWRYGIAPVLPVAAALIAIAGAITAAMIQAGGNIRAQLTAQKEISDRDQRRQDRIDRAVRTQLLSYLINISIGAEFVVDHPLFTATAILPNEIEALIARIRDADVTIALSVPELRALLDFAVLVRNTPDVVRGIRRAGDETNPEDETPELLEAQRIALLRWDAFACGLFAARVAAVFGDDGVLRGYRQWSRGDTLLESLSDAMMFKGYMEYPGYAAEIESQIRMRSVDNDLHRVALYRAFDLPRNASK